MLHKRIVKRKSKHEYCGGAGRLNPKLLARHLCYDFYQYQRFYQRNMALNQAMLKALLSNSSSDSEEDAPGSQGVELQGILVPILLFCTFCITIRGNLQIPWRLLPRSFFLLKHVYFT